MLGAGHTQFLEKLNSTFELYSTALWQVNPTKILRKSRIKTCEKQEGDFYEGIYTRLPSKT